MPAARTADQRCVHVQQQAVLRADPATAGAANPFAPVGTFAPSCLAQMSRTVTPFPAIGLRPIESKGTVVIIGVLPPLIRTTATAPFG
jgi:hypothetical protein